MSGEVVHSLGVWLTACVAALCSVASVTGARRRGVRLRRGAALLGGVDGDSAAARAGWGKQIRAVSGDRETAGVRDVVTRWAEPAGAGLTVWILVEGAAGALAGAGVAAAVWHFRRTGRARRPGGSGTPTEDELSASRQLPLAADLLAACISAGAGPRQAAEAVGESLRGPLGERLVRAAVEIRLGGDPSLAWGRLGGIPGAGPLARCLDRAGETGAPAAEPVARLADAIRAARADAAVAKAQRAGVLITAPVGLCFLPAFLAVGVAPVIVGLAGGLLHTG
ncbi:type II secretion system F family protein [Streptomyces sp. NPDC008125]|uniref:type II secretion system F family protein n=1 Tax=Streptomyces sp. NPDC008125 TaxID=3364811 RepID=UPI0036EC6DFC